MLEHPLLLTDKLRISPTKENLYISLVISLACTHFLSVTFNWRNRLDTYHGLTINSVSIFRS